MWRANGRNGKNVQEAHFNICK